MHVDPTRNDAMQCSMEVDLMLTFVRPKGCLVEDEAQGLREWCVSGLERTVANPIANL
jgi:hypothetical protein